MVSWFLALVGLSFTGWSILSVRRVLYPEQHALNPPHHLPSYTRHLVTAPDGSSFTVWRLEASTPRARVVLCHGYYANRYQVLELAHELRKRRYECLLFELRGHGERSGPCTLGVKETEDAIAVLRWAKTTLPCPSLAVGVVGLSMGAAVACQVAAVSPEVRAVVVDSVYSRLFPVLKRAVWQRYHLTAVPWAWLTWWGLQLVLGRRLAPRDPAVLALRLHQPLFAIEGGKDRRVVPMSGREFYRCWAGPKERWFEPSVAHVSMFAHHPAEYANRVAGFFDRVLREAA